MQRISLQKAFKAGVLLFLFFIIFTCFYYKSQFQLNSAFYAVLSILGMNWSPNQFGSRVLAKSHLPKWSGPFKTQHNGAFAGFRTTLNVGKMNETVVIMVTNDIK